MPRSAAPSRVRPSRVLDLSGPEAAEALGISPELFRKRLHHARTAIEAFTKVQCGLASDMASRMCDIVPPAWVGAAGADPSSRYRRFDDAIEVAGGSLTSSVDVQILSR